MDANKHEDFSHEKAQEAQILLRIGWGEGGEAG
jgi:hypothetical protein